VPLAPGLGVDGPPQAVSAKEADSTAAVATMSRTRGVMAGTVGHSAIVLTVGFTTMDPPVL
jgi:hypothetical protein